MYDNQFKPATAASHQKHQHEVYMNNQSTLTDGIYYNNFIYKPASFGSMKGEMSDCIYSTPNSISCDSKSSSRLSSPTLAQSVPVVDSTGYYYEPQHMDDEPSHYQMDFYVKDSFAPKTGTEEMAAFEQPRVNRGGRKQVKIGTTKRNARERNRVRFINDCFEVLREHIPLELVGDLKNQKLSKVETLKYASIYIQLLSELLENGGESENSSNVQVKSEPEREMRNEAVSSAKKRARVEPALSEPKSSSISITNINININEPKISTVSNIQQHQQTSVYMADQYSPCSTSSSSSSSSCSSSYQHQPSSHQNFLYQNQTMNYQSYAPYSKPAHEQVYATQSSMAGSYHYPNHCSKSFIINSFLNNPQTNCQYSLI